MRSHIKTPTCPVCGALPLFAWEQLVPWLCTNEACDVFGWDPFATAKENLDDMHEIAWVETSPEDYTGPSTRET